MSANVTHAVSIVEENLRLTHDLVQTGVERDQAKKSLSLCQGNFDRLLLDLAAAENKIAALEAEIERLKKSPASILLDEWEGRA